METALRTFHNERISTTIHLLQLKAAFGVSVRSVRLVGGRLEFYSRSCHTKNFKK